MSRKAIKSIISSIISIALILTCFNLSAIAANQNIMINGIIYGFNDSLKYNINESQYQPNSCAGTFSINGNIDRFENGDITKYYIMDGNLSFEYKPNKTYTNYSEQEWHFVDDNSKEVNGVTLPEDIKKGAIFIQTSFDRNKWVTIKDTIKTNIFDDSNSFPSPYYTTTDLQLINGCYYRIVVAYKVTKKSDTKEWYQFSNPDLYKFYTEVYEFYASYEEKDTQPTNEGESYYWDTTEAVVVDDGFSTIKDIEKNDPHLGRKLGKFEIKGFTSKTDDNVFLKNVGDEILFQFKLNPDSNIDALFGNSNWIINDVSNGCDRLLNVGSQYFGRGTLILSKTDYKGVTLDPPIIHKNFLEALAYPGADTKIQLLEEGDYEATLDYEIKDNGNWGKLYDYRMSFSFKIRNGNTEVYPKDSTIGSYLGNNSVTPNGFTLDWAKSRYLKTNIHAFYWEPSTKTTYKSREFMNQAAKESEKYTKPGVYTITVTNPTTDPYEKHPTTMRIYVGVDPIIMAALKGEYASKPLDTAISDILKLQEGGWEIDEWGNMKAPEPPQTTTVAETTITEVSTSASNIVTTAVSASETTTVATEIVAEAINTNVDESKEAVDPSAPANNNTIPVFIGIGIAALAVGIIAVVFILRKRNNKKEQ